LLVVVTALMIWGPPRLRLTSRPLEIALTNPADLDAAALFQVLVWVTGAVLIAIILVGRLLTGRRMLPALVSSTSLRYYMLYFALALASAAYSVSPLYTIFSAAKILVSIMAVVLLTDRGSLSERRPLILQLFFLVNAAQWMAEGILYFVAPELVGKDIPLIGFRLNGGIFGDYGGAAACAGLYFLSEAVFYSRRVSQVLHWTLYGLTWVFVVASRTRSTIVGAAVMFLAVVLLYRRISTRVIAILAIFLALGVFVVEGGVDPLVEFAMRGQNMSSLVTLTGRSQAFDFLYEQWKQAPWLGYGYGAGSRFLLIRFVKETGLGIGSAHDALSRVFCDLGVVGTLVLTCALLAMGIEMFRLMKVTSSSPRAHALALQLIALASFAVLNCIVSSGIAEVPFPVLITAVGAAIARRQASRELQCRSVPSKARSALSLRVSVL
jgi:O-antigen ligase